MNWQLEEWYHNIKSGEESLVLEALEDPPLVESEIVVESIAKKLVDASSTIRLAAAEALSNYDCDKSRKALRNCIVNETDSLVREYAISSLGQVALVEDLLCLVGLIYSESNSEVLIHVYTGIAAASQKVLIDKMIPIIKGDDTTLISSAINALTYSLMPSDYRKLINLINRESKKAQNENIMSDMQEACLVLSKLQDIGF